MTIAAKFKEYIWLVNTIHKAKRITFAEIQDLWLSVELSEGVEMARSTFVRHKAAIEDIFGIYIDCDKQHGFKYFIANEHVLREESVQNWMLSTLSMNNVISESLSLQDRILLQPVPYEGEYLEMIIDAMKRGVKVEIDYQRYGTKEWSHRVLEPYCIKMFKQRWYVLGHLFHEAANNDEAADYLALFSFDRIIRMSLTNERFQMDPDFDAQQYFSECYGVLVSDGTPVERIVIRAYHNERYYMRDLPFHASQREIKWGDDYADFEYYMRPTADFSGYLLSGGAYIKVISPQWLADKVKAMHLEAAKLYDEKK